MRNKFEGGSLELVWKKEITEGIGGSWNVKFIGGSIVIGTLDGNLKCFDLEGNLRWEYKEKNICVDRRVVSNIKYNNKNIFVATTDGNLKCFDLEGNLRWEYKEKNIRVEQVTENYVIAHTTGNSESCVYLFDINGNLKWKFPIEGNIQSVKVSNDNVIIGAKNVYFFTIEGILKWKMHIPFVTGVNMHDNNITVCTHEGYLYLLDIDGNVKWEFTADDEIHTTYILDRYVLICDTDSGLYLFDLDGNLKIKYIPPTGMCIPFFDMQKGFVVVGAEGELSFFDLNEEKMKWQQKIEEDPEWPSPILVPSIDNENNLILVGTDIWNAGFIYIFDFNGNLKAKIKIADKESVIISPISGGKYFVLYADNISVFRLLKNKLK